MLSLRISLHFLANNTFSSVLKFPYFSAVKFQGVLHKNIVFNQERVISFGTMSDLDEKINKFLLMPLEEKRKMYKCDGFNTLANIQTWPEYFENNLTRLATQFECCSEKVGVEKQDVRPDLASKVSLWKGDITSLEIDAIVNAANRSLLGGGGVDGAIHKAAGDSLRKECSTLNGCEVGEAKITGGYLLPAKYVIHTVGPQGENPKALQSSYSSCLNLLTVKNLSSVAFPCISTGIYGYPQEAAAKVALQSVRSFLEKNSNTVDRIIFCVFLTSDVSIYENLLQLYFPIS